MEKTVAFPQKLIVLYVKGLASKEEHEDLEEWLTNFDPGIEKAEGVVFDPAVSKFILTLTDQTVASSQVADVVKYLAKMLDVTPTWKLVRHASFTIMVERNR